MLRKRSSHTADLMQCRETRSDGVGDLSPHGHVGVHVDTKIPDSSDRRYGDVADANRLSRDQVLTP